MTFDLTKFDLGAMLKCSPQLRSLAIDAPTLEVSAQQVCRFLYDELRSPSGDRACALVRCYKTVAFSELEPDLQAFARGIMGREQPKPTMKCLTLMATRGQSPGWNSRFLSYGHKAIPLPSPEIVEQAPMIAQLIKDFGIELSAVLQPTPELVRELSGKSYGVFHVEDALGSPYIPAQDFVKSHRIQSVLGCGGMLGSGDLFAVILFTTVRISTSVADRFKALALDVKAGFARFPESKVFNRKTALLGGS